MAEALQELCDITETATISWGDAPDSVVREIKRCVDIEDTWVSITRKNKWPKVSDLEDRLPPEIANQAITEQKRDKPVLVFEQRGISVGQNDRA